MPTASAAVFALIVADQKGILFQGCCGFRVGVDDVFRLSNVVAQIEKLVRLLKRLASWLLASA